MMLYVAVTADKYELPICVAETGAELARKLNMPVKTLYRLIWLKDKNILKEQGKNRGYNIVKVEVEDGE